MDVARWVRPATELAQEVLFWWVSPEVRVKFHALFLEGPVLVQLFMPFFITSIFFCSLIFVFSLKIKLFVLGLSFDFLLFFVLLYSDLKVVFKRIILSGSKLVFFQFGYCGFSLISHAVRLWFMIFSKLALVSLDI